MHRLLRPSILSFLLLGVSVAAAPARAREFEPYNTSGEGDDDDDGDGEFKSTDGFDVLRNQVDLELIDLASSSLSLRYERSLSPWASVAIHPQWWWGGDTALFDFGVTMQLRCYLEGHAMNGWYVSAQFGFFEVHGIDPQGAVRADQSYLYAAFVGYNWTIAHVVAMYFGAGLAYTEGSNRLEETWHYPLYVLGPFPVFELGVGVSF